MGVINIQCGLRINNGSSGDLLIGESDGVCSHKPLIIAEFEVEALYGQSGNKNVAASWSEEHQVKLYRLILDQGYLKKSGM